MELNTSYRLTRSQSLCGIRSTSAGNYPVVPVSFYFLTFFIYYFNFKRTYSITDFADYRREVLAHPITWPRVPVLRPRISTYVYRPHWTYRSHWPHSQIHFQCPPGPYEYRKDPFHWAYPYHSTWTKYRTEWLEFRQNIF